MSGHDDLNISHTEGKLDANTSFGPSQIAIAQGQQLHWTRVKTRKNNG